MDYKDAIIKGHHVKKCIGEGQSRCVDCLKETGWSCEWTSFCYLHNNEIVCYDHLVKRLDKGRIKTFSLEELAKTMGLKIGDKIRVYHSTDRNLRIRPYVYILNDQYYMAPYDCITMMIGNETKSLSYYIGCEYVVLNRMEDN